MMNGISVMIWLGIATAALAAWCWLKVFSARSRDSAWLPVELKGAKLLYAEQRFTITNPLALVARVDRGYALNGTVHLVEFKTREVPRDYRSDIIELSAQRLAVEQSTGYAVSDIGYVVIQSPARGERSVQQVRLMTAENVVALAQRRARILEGRIVPQYTKSEALCRKCAFQEECRPELAS
ncbi:CRISPR-associated protein Cas4 [Noviherbaspirillum autotrophicum]|nr:PD-(D/E)XK nuclease family protein [Noviherbaspirillum autotrophicum]